MLQKVYTLFSKPKNLAVLNGVLISVLISTNIYFQAFCIPTTWAIVLLTICTANTILYPLLKSSKIAPAMAFLNGITLFVSLYCVLFLEHLNLFGLVMIISGLGFVIFIPHFFIMQLILNNLINQKNRTSRYFFLTAIILCIGTAIFIRQEYKQAIQSFEKFKESDFTQLDRSFMTEKILGMHFIYHTRFCEYDGWRPPKHEPILVIGMWLNNRIDPIHVDLEKRLELYKMFFPEKKYKFDCSCGLQYSTKYHNDQLWKN